MFIIYGTRTMKKELGQQQHLFNCSHCNNLVNYTLISVWEWFTLFWIPIFPVGRKKYYSICPVCGYGFKHTKEEMEQILQNNAAAINVEEEMPATIENENNE